MKAPFFAGLSGLACAPSLEAILSHSSPPSLPEGCPVQPTSLSPTLSSNNPFRNRAASPSSIDAAFATPTSPFEDPPQRPQSRNPFFDPPPPTTMASHANSKSLSAEEIFDSLTLDDRKPRGKANAPPQRHPSDPRVSRRGENKPLIKPSKTSHRPTRSQEEAMKARRLPASAPWPVPSGSPQRKQPPQPPQQPPRRNSESSIMDFNVQPITEEELKMIESKRLRERQRRDGRPSGRETHEGKDRSKSRRPSRRLDIIDQLDATSIYGTGLFHHDGPFDALNPHRNRQNSRRAPMQAFPKDSLNNSLGGAGPLNRNPDHAIFMGNGTDEAFRDYAGSAKNAGGNACPGPCSSGEAAIFDPVARGSIVHGDESCGLGTSTFLEGTPAARTAIARREAEQAQELVEGGLQRKKSLAQRIRHINKGPRDFAPSGRMTNPDGAYSRLSPEPGPSGGSAGSESNPFSEFSKGEEMISVKPRGGTCSPKTLPRGPRRLSGGGAGATRQHGWDDAARGGGGQVDGTSGPDEEPQGRAQDQQDLGSGSGLGSGTKLWDYTIEEGGRKRGKCGR